MIREGTCEYCGVRFTKQRNPHQRYCSNVDCQRKRKNAWRREKVKVDDDYKNNQQQANKRWQTNHTDYWRSYRASHPDYVKRNREAQRVRDGISTNNVSSALPNGTASGNASHLAKCDAFLQKNFVESGCYWLMPINEDLAKSDALKIKITLISNNYYEIPNLAKSPLYSQDG